MPAYGLDDKGRRKEPWGIPKELLAPGKVFTDPVHGDIHLTRLEALILDSPPYQRLRRVRQLGETHQVYPGAVHTRFSHGLGTLRVTQYLLDSIWDQRDSLHPTEDLIGQWTPNERDGRWAQATVLARLGALLHDLCHVPAGHTIEDDLGLLVSHDKNLERFRRYWRSVGEHLHDRIRPLQERLGPTSDGRKQGSWATATHDALINERSDLYRELRGLIVSKGEGAMPVEEMEYPFCADLVGNTICADLLDYLARDHLFAGLPQSLGRRFIAAFFVVPDGKGPYSKRLALNIMRDQHERTDVVSELLKALRYRYELTERVLVHRVKLAADAMLGEAIERWGWAIWYREANERGDLDPAQVGERFNPHKVPTIRLQKEPAPVEPQSGEPVTHEVKRKLDEEVSSIGDDALIEQLINLPNRQDFPAEVRVLLRESSELARALRDRRLFRTAARVGPREAPAEILWKRYGSADQRAALEREAQRFAGLDDSPRVILWLPPPEMRLKLAEVLVQHAGGVSPFVAYERAGAGRGSEIYDAHNALWAAYVFADRSVEPAKVDRAVVSLAKQLGVRWERYAYLGARPEHWPIRLAIAEKLGFGQESEIDQQFRRHRIDLERIAARKGLTYDTLARRVNQVISS